jgi:hypothetical protein
MGRAGVRLWNLVAQSPEQRRNNFGGGAEGADREKKRSVGACLLQVVQERDSVIEQAIEGCVDKHKWISTFSLDVCRHVEIKPRQPRDCSGSSERSQLLYVLAWLLPLGLCWLKHLRREWVMSSFITALVAMGFTAYHNSARDAGPAVARPIFSIAGPS